MSQLSRWLPFSREPQDYDLARKAMAWGWYPTYSRERHYLSADGLLLAVESGPIWAVRRRNLPYVSCEAL